MVLDFNVSIILTQEVKCNSAFEYEVKLHLNLLYNWNDLTEASVNPVKTQGCTSNSSYAKETSLKVNYSLKTQIHTAQIQLEEPTIYLQTHTAVVVVSVFKAGEHI